MSDWDEELLDDDQRLIAEAVRGVCSAFDDDYWAHCDHEHEFPWDFYPRMAEGGWVGIALPEEYGGGGRGITDAAVVLHEVAASGAAMNGCSALHLTVFGLNPVVKFGNDRLKAEFLPRAAVGDLHVAFGVTEPDAGTDTGRITTRAEADGNGGWRITGRKIWTSKALEAEVVLLLARTGDKDSGLRGLSLFLADLDPDYVDIRPIPKVGRNAVASCEVAYDGLPVESWRLVGTENDGFRHILHGLNPERILLASEACGIGEVALDRATTYAKERIVFDRPIGANQAISHPLAQARIQLKAAWMMALHAGRRYDAGLECGEAANSAKYLAAEASFFAADRAVQTLGGMGYASEYHVERYWREARLQRIAPVTQEMTLNYIARTDHGPPEELLSAMVDARAVAGGPRRRAGPAVRFRDLRSRRRGLRRRGVVPCGRRVDLRARSGNSAERRRPLVGGRDRHRDLPHPPARPPTRRFGALRRNRRARVVQRQRRDRHRPGLGAELGRDPARRERVGRGVGAAGGRQRPSAHAGFLPAPRRVGPRALRVALRPERRPVVRDLHGCGAHGPRRARSPVGSPPASSSPSGSSQSANRLVTYVNAVQPVDDAVDAFLVHGRVGTTSPPLAAGAPSPDPLTFRTDLAAPVLVLESEFDTLRSWAARQPDSEHFRLWEVAGSTHQDEFVERTLNVQFARDLAVEVPGCDCAVNDMPFHYVENAALSHLRAWVRHGEPAPELPRISIDADGEIDRDVHGNARGGIRLPHLTVPVAQYGPVGTPQSCALRGFVKPFTPEQLAALYRSRDDYLARFDAATIDAVEAGFLLAADAVDARALLS